MLAKCDFHSLIVCSCGKCDRDGPISCKGKDYKTRIALKVLCILCYTRSNVTLGLPCPRVIFTKNLDKGIQIGWKVPTVLSFGIGLDLKTLDAGLV